MPPRLLGENARRGSLEPDGEACLLLDGAAPDKKPGPRIGMSQRQGSGHEHKVINGIGLVSCLCGHAGSGRFRAAGCRVCAPGRDGKARLDHGAGMLKRVRERGLAFRAVLTDCWHAAKGLMINMAGRRGDSDSDNGNGGQRPCRHVAEPGHITLCPAQSSRFQPLLAPPPLWP